MRPSQGAPSHLDDTFRAIDHPHRRAALRLLDAGDDATTVGNLAARLAAAVDDLTETRARAALHHVHLPMLQTGDFVEYDARSGAVRYRPPEFATDVVDETLPDDPVTN